MEVPIIGMITYLAMITPRRILKGNAVFPGPLDKPTPSAKALQSIKGI